MLDVKKLLTKMLQWIKTPIITNSTNVNTLYKAVRSDTGVSVGFGIGSGGQAHGVWSDSLNSWMVSANNGDVYLHGTRFNNLFVTETHAYKTNNLSITSGSSLNGTLSITKSGYVPVAISGWRGSNGTGSGGSRINPYALYLSASAVGSGTITIGLSAIGGAVTNCSFTVDVLWIKNI